MKTLIYATPAVKGLMLGDTGDLLTACVTVETHIGMISQRNMSSDNIIRSEFRDLFNYFSFLMSYRLLYGMMAVLAKSLCESAHFTLLSICPVNMYRVFIAGPASEWT